MSQQADFETFVTLVDVAGSTVQNVQELASVWGEIAGELEAVGAHVEDSYAVLGSTDFVVVFEAPDRDAAFRASLVVERHGLDTRTMPATSTEEFAELVEDV